MIAWLLAGVFVQGDVWLNLNNGDLVVRHVKTHSFSVDEKTQIVAFTATGGPVEVVQNPKGATLQGDSLSGNVRKLKDGTYRLESADVIGHGKFLVDSDLATAPTASGKSGTGLSSLSSNDFTLRSTGNGQTVALPGDLTFTDERHGTTKDEKLGEIPFEETSVITGSSGTLDMSFGSSGHPPQIQTGSVEGPVHFHSKRTEHPPKTSIPGVTEYDVIADRLVLDFTKPTGTITAIGHVHWSKTGEIPMSGVEDKSVLTLDADHRIEGLSGEGYPATTIVSFPAPKLPAPKTGKKSPRGGGV